MFGILGRDTLRTCKRDFAVSHAILLEWTFVSITCCMLTPHRLRNQAQRICRRQLPDTTTKPVLATNNTLTVFEGQTLKCPSPKLICDKQQRKKSSVETVRRLLSLVLYNTLGMAGDTLSFAPINAIRSMAINLLTTPHVTHVESF